MKVEFLEQFYKDLDNIDDSKIKLKIADFIEQIESVNILSELSNVKKLIGYKFAYRYKLGHYRIGFYYENNIVELARILHRKDIYKQFP